MHTAGEQQHWLAADQHRSAIIADGIRLASELRVRGHNITTAAAAAAVAADADDAAAAAAGDDIAAGRG